MISIGIDLGGTNIAVGAVDEAGKIIGRANRPTGAQRPYNEVIRDMADKAPCVIVGRCADYVLRYRSPFRLFFYADIADRMERCRKRNEEQKSMNHDVLRKIITQTDKSRSRYYEFLSGQKWGAKENYDLCINTSSADTEKLLQCVISLL